MNEDVTSHLEETEDLRGPAARVDARRRIVEAAIKAAPELSDAEIASRTNTEPSFVALIRTGELNPQPAKK